MPFHQAELGTLVKAHYGKALKKENRDDAGVFDVYGSSGQVGFHIESICDYPTLVVGRKGSVGDIVWAPKGGWVIDTAYFLEILNPDILDLRYLFYALKRANLANKTITTSIPGLNRDDFYETKISLPPLAEQKRIAAILDKADSLRRKNQQAIQLADQFLRAVFLDMFGDPVANSKGTDLISITECFHITTGRLNSNAAVEGGKYPFFTCAKDIFAIDDYAFDQEALLLAGNNAQAIYDVKHYKGKFNAYQRTYVLTLKKLDYSYPFYKFALEYQLENLKRVSKGSNTKYITMEIMNRTMLPAPSSKKQKEFVSYFDRYEKINKRNVKSTQISDACFSSLSQKAFAGEL